MSAQEYMAGVTFGFRQQVSWKEIITGITDWTFLCLDPQEILHFGQLFALQATSSIQFVHITLDFGGDQFGSPGKGVQVKGRKRLPDYPIRHWVRVGTHNAETEASCFKDRCPSPHERVSDDTI